MLRRITFLSLLFIFMSSCSKKGLLTDQEIKWLKDNPDLKVSVLGYNPTYQFENDQGVIEGVFIDYITLIEQKINYKFTRIKYTELPSLFEDAENGYLDIIPALQKTEERLKYLSFHGNLFQSEYVIVTRKEDVEDITFDILSEKKIVLPKGHAIKDLLLEKIPDLEISFFENEIEALKALDGGMHDAFVGPKAVAYHFIKNQNLVNLRIGEATPLWFRPELTVQKSKPILNTIISKAIDDISIKEKDEIFNKWLLTKNEPVYYELSFWFSVLAFLGTFIIIILIFNWRLKKKVIERTTKLELALEETRKSNNVKNKFLQNISHEIRTPMNGILGYSELLRKKNISEQEQTSYINTIIQSGKKLVHTVDNILEMSNLHATSNTPDNVPVNLPEIFENLENLFKAEASKKGIHLKIERHPYFIDTISIDRSRLIKILNNITSNAVKFTDKGTVKISYSSHDNILEIKIKDTGIGIAPDMRNIIFERFSNLEKEMYEKFNTGLGIGLTIAKKNVLTMGGEISFISEENKGTTFLISLPFESNALNQNQPNMEIQPTKNNTYKVLVAEDEEINFLLVNSILTRYESYNFIVIRAENGKEAVRIFNENDDISLVLMDIRMPIMDGYQATRIIKSLKPELPIVVHTAYSTDKDIQNAYEAGCDHVISKPINLDEFKKVINMFIDKIHA